MKNKNRVAYAEQYASFLLYNLDQPYYENIKEIILFGSVSRGEATTESDVDIFINVFKENKRLVEKIEHLTKKFYDTEFFRLWKLLGVENDIKTIVGIVDGWDLKLSIIANGIILYGKYQQGINNGEPQVILYWNKIKPESRRVLLSKKLYGYSYKNKKYEGIFSLAKATKLSSNCIITPLMTFELVIKIFKELKISYRTIYVGKM